MNNDLEELRGYAVGATMAIGNAVRALMEIHPDPALLAQVMERTRQEGLVVLLNSRAQTDKAIASYQETWDLLALALPSPPNSQVGS